MNKLKRKGLFGRLSALAVSAAMLVALPSCGPSDQGEIAKTGKVMVIGKANPTEVNFWKDVESGVLDAGNEMGYEVKFQYAQNDNDYESQVGFISEAVRDDYDVIVIAPNSKDQLNEELQKAVDSGIEIIAINSTCDFDGIKCLIASSDGAAASSCCDQVAKLLRESNNDKLSGVGKIAIVAHTADAAEARIKVFKNRLANEIMMDMQSSGESISGTEYADESDEDGVVAVLPDGTKLIRPEVAANQAAAAAAKSGLTGEAVVEAANAAAQEAAQKIKEAGYEISKEGEEGGEGGSSQGGAPNNDIPDPAEGMITPDEAAQQAVEEARKIGLSSDKFAEYASKAAEEAAAAIAKARAEAGYVVPEGSESNDSSGGSGGGAAGRTNYFQQLQDEYFIETERCVTSFEAFVQTKNLFDPDDDGKADENPEVRVVYATSSQTTIGVCQAIDQLDLKEKVIVVGYNSDDRIISYLKTGVLDATVVQNPYSMGYLGVIYAKKLVDGNTITKNINTGVTLVTSENINDSYIQAIIFPGKEVDINEGYKKDESSNTEETTAAEGENTPAEGEAAPAEGEAQPEDAEKNENGGNE